jgi:hypothetical protein
MPAIPLKATHEGTNEADQTVVPVPVVSETLKRALFSLDKSSLLSEIIVIAQKNAAAQRLLEDRLLVRGRDVVPSHVDSDAENSSDVESRESEPESENIPSKKRKVIGLGDDEVIGRFAVCSNCEMQFDITEISRGHCVWHEGLWSYVN